MGILVIFLVVRAWRLYGGAHHVTKAAIASLVLTIVEGGIGALLVRAELVADNASVARAIVIALHLVNTYILLTAIVATAWWSVGHAPIQLRGQPRRLVGLLAGGILLMAILGMTGAVTALGDTLFPAETLVEGFNQDLDPTAHFLIQLRVVHPVVAILTGIYLVLVARWVAGSRPDAHTTRFAQATTLVFFIQVGVGTLNLGLLAPIWMQIIHLVMADLLWMVFVLLAIATLNPAWLTAPATPLPRHWWRSVASVGD
jgi:heme A synthase